MDDHSEVNHCQNSLFSKANDVQWASSMETKRYPIVVFNCKILSESESNPVGTRSQILGTRIYFTHDELIQFTTKLISSFFDPNILIRKQISFDLQTKQLRGSNHQSNFSSQWIS